MQKEKKNEGEGGVEGVKEREERTSRGKEERTSREKEDNK